MTTPLTEAEHAILDRLSEAPGGSAFLDPEHEETVRSLEAQGLVEAEYDEDYLTVTLPNYWANFESTLKRAVVNPDFDPD